MGGYDGRSRFFEGLVGSSIEKERSVYYHVQLRHQNGRHRLQMQTGRELRTLSILFGRCYQGGLHRMASKESRARRYYSFKEQQRCTKCGVSLIEQGRRGKIYCGNCQDEHVERKRKLRELRYDRWGKTTPRLSGCTAQVRDAVEGDTVAHGTGRTDEVRGRKNVLYKPERNSSTTYTQDR